MSKKSILSFITGAFIFGSVGVYAGQYMATANPFPIQLNGKQVNVEGYNINDNTYFKLRDIASVVGGFDVDFKDNTILLSKDGYEYEKIETNTSTVDFSLIQATSEDYSNNYFSQTIGKHKIEVNNMFLEPPHIRSKFYIDDTLIAENIFPDFITDNESIYYATEQSANTGIFKVNLNTLTKKELFKTDGHIILDVHGKYLYAGGDSNSDFIIYDLEAEEILAQPSGYFIEVTENDILLCSLSEPEQNISGLLYKANPDGSNPQFICDNIQHIEDNYVYYLDYIQQVSENTYKMQIKRTNIITLETEAVTDIHEADYTVFHPEEREIHFGKFGIEEQIIEEY